MAAAAARWKCTSRDEKTTHSLQGSLLFALFKCEPAEKHIVRKVLLTDKALVIMQKRNFLIIAYCLEKEGEKKSVWTQTGRESKICY